MVLRTTSEKDLHLTLILAATGPTEVVTGYGILKTTEDLAPVLIQRRTTRQTAYVWAIALDGAAPDLRLSAVSDASGRTLPLSEAVLVQVASLRQPISILVNPDATKVVARLSDGSSVRTDKPFNVY
jgi:hypothetical protein